MKRILLIISILIVSVVLMACKDNKAGDVTAEITFFEVEQTLVTFKFKIEDPKSEVTGAVTVSLFDDESKQAATKDFMDVFSEVTHTFSNLDNEMTYTLKIYATVGRNLVILEEKTFNLASTEIVHITTVDEFEAMINNRAGNYVLDNDLDFSGETYVSPFSSAFSGTFDGQGFTLKNIAFGKIVTYTGVFGFVSTGTIKNVNFDNVTIGTDETPLAMSTSSRVGIVAGYISGATGKIENVNVTNSQINYSTSSSIQAYVGGIVGESKGIVEHATLDTTNITLKTTAYGRIRVGGVVGHLGEDGVVKYVESNTDLNVSAEGASIKDRDITINVGGIIGYHNGRNVSKSVEHLISTGDITIDLDYGTITGTTKGTYSVYVGGIAGIAYSSVNQSLYSGSISLNHEKNEHEEDVNKYFFVGGLFGFYGSGKTSLSNLRFSELVTLDIHVSDDVTLKASQTVADISSQATNEFNYYGDLGLMINDVDESANDTIDLILTTDDYFTSEWILDWLNN